MANILLKYHCMYIVSHSFFDSGEQCQHWNTTFPKIFIFLDLFKYKKFIIEIIATILASDTSKIKVNIHLTSSWALFALVSIEIHRMKTLLDALCFIFRYIYTTNTLDILCYFIILLQGNEIHTGNYCILHQNPRELFSNIYSIRLSILLFQLHSMRQLLYSSSHCYDEPSKYS